MKRVFIPLYSIKSREDAITIATRYAEVTKENVLELGSRREGGWDLVVHIPEQCCEQHLYTKMALAGQLVGLLIGELLLTRDMTANEIIKQAFSSQDKG
jgi:hypothetical protein